MPALNYSEKPSPFGINLLAMAVSNVGNVEHAEDANFYRSRVLKTIRYNDKNHIRAFTPKKEIRKLNLKVPSINLHGFINANGKRNEKPRHSKACNKFSGNKFMEYNANYSKISEEERNRLQSFLKEQRKGIEFRQSKKSFSLIF
jgi:hypothetical protein